MSSRPKKRWWRWCRRFLRGIRIGILLLVLVLVVSGIYVNEVGLPDFVKAPLLDKLHARGVDLKFTRLRLRFYRGIVAENVRFGRLDPSEGNPEFSAREVDLKLDHQALRHFEILINALIIKGGRVSWPIAGTNQPARALTVDGIETQLQLLPEDRWQLDHFGAEFAGAKVELSGIVSHASAIRDWSVFHKRAEAQPQRLQARLKSIASIIDRIKFDGTPTVKLIIHGDGKDISRFNGLLSIDAPGADTPWGTLDNGHLLARLVPVAGTNGIPHGEFALRADMARTPWGGAKSFQLQLTAVADEAMTNLARCSLELSALACTTKWAQAKSAQLSATWSHSLTNPIPVAGSGKLRLSEPHSDWASADELRLETRLTGRDENAPLVSDASWAWWSKLEPYLLDWSLRATNLRSTNILLNEMECDGSWRAPELTITNLQTEYLGGKLNATAGLDVAARLLQFSARTDIDAHKVTPFLTEGARHWLSQYAWEVPPLVNASGQVVLPAWTNHDADWRGEVLPTLSISGDVTAGKAEYRGIPILSAHSHIHYTNQTWNLPDLVAVRPEGQIRIEHTANDRTHEFYFHIHSTASVKAFRHLLEERAQERMDELVFTDPPTIEGEVWGRWHDHESIGARGDLVITNFTYRGESASSLRTGLSYTNHLLEFTGPEVDSGGRHARADRILVNFDTRLLFITNGFSTIEPLTILHCIGPQVTAHMEPYQFLQPPTVHANGLIPLHEDVHGDVTFDIDGGPFRWMRFNVDHISGLAHWYGEHLTLTNMSASFYKGQLAGGAEFDFNPGDSTDFAFDTSVTNSNLHLLIQDLFTPSNHLEGSLSGRLVVTSASSHDLQSWFGYGHVDLKDGLIWDIPIFGVFSPVLDSIVPGLGKSRASEGSAVFMITNSVIRSGDLIVHAPALRMSYKGTVDFQGRTSATVEASLLRDTGIVGRLVSIAFWPLTKLFEYKVSGTLSNPKTEPLYVPKLLMMPLHPISTLKELFSQPPPPTNAPPAKVAPLSPPGDSPGNNQH